MRTLRDSDVPIGEDRRPVVRPLSATKRALLVVAGSLSLGIGVVGIYLPGLPTTPFLLLTAACYARSSQRMYRWLMAQPRLSQPIHLMIERRAIPQNVKVVSLILAWVVLGGMALFVVESTWGRAALLTVAVVKTGIMFRIPTLRP